MARDDERRLARRQSGNERALSSASPALYRGGVGTTAASKRSRRRLVELACICAATAQIGWFLFPEMNAIQGGDWKTRDQILMLPPHSVLPPDLVFIAIDETSIKLDQLWPEDLAASPTLRAMATSFPWPRSVYADALDRVLGAGARLVILDLIFDKPHDDDRRLKQALDAHPSQVVLASNYSEDERDPRDPNDNVPAITVPSPSLIADPTHDPRVGYANFWPGDDEIVRETIFATTLQERVGKTSHPGEPVYRSIAAAAAHQLGRESPQTLSHRAIPFRFSPAAPPTYPFHTLFVPYEWKQDLRDGAVLEDKIVVIGPSATRLQDFHQTPIQAIPGPLVHVNALAAALNGGFYTLGGSIDRLVLLLGATLLALVVTWRFQRHPLLALSFLSGAALVFLFACYASAHWLAYMPHPLQPLIALFLAGVPCIAWNFAQERRESGRMRSMLDRYVSRNLVREVLDNREDFLQKLGGTRQPMTIFFSDVRGFTSFAERQDAAVVVEQLNEYLGEMVRIIFRQHGTVDKFMGDGILAVWGNVVSEGPAADAVRAVNATLEMIARLPRLNEKWTARGLPPFAIGIGLHHGEAVFGNIGSAEKMEPTVIGDTVNLTSRVEGLTKKYGVTLCITQPLAELVADHFLFRSVDLVQVVGKSRPVEIFTVLGRRGETLSDGLKNYEGAVADFRARRFAEAAAEFRLSLEAMPDDPLCKIYLERCEAFIAAPPPDDWTGAEIATSK